MFSHPRLVRCSPGGLLALALGLSLAVATPAGAAYPDASSASQYGDTAGYDGSYGYVRTLEGAATLIQGDTGDRDPLQVNQPVLVGDRIWVSPRGRVEVVLSDRNLLRIDGGSEVAFEALAGSPDRQDRNTVLRLPQGNLQLVVVRDFLGEGVPRVDTANVTVYPRDLGSYRITADGADWSEVVAREGSAEVVTREGSLVVRAGEQAVIEGDRRPRERVRSASRLDQLELWGQRLDREARYASSGYVDESLRYEAAGLDRHGTWVQIDNRYAWRPRVDADWRPYHDGRWRFTSLGLTWVSNEPWGWVPYHYGSWDYLPGHGWLWFAGHRFAPAWVYWNWTDHYAGWVPVGYYTRHYRPHFAGHFGFRFGIYGWAGGHWSHYDRWTFCSTRFLGLRDQHHHSRAGDRFGREHRYAVPKRGVLTTDTRGLSRVAVQRGQGIEDVLAARNGRDLPDVTDFVAKRRNLPEDVRSRVLVDSRDPKGTGRTPERTSVVAVDGIPGSTSARRTPDTIDRGPTARLPDRAAIDRGGSGARGDAPAPAVAGRKPADKPATPRTVARPEEGFRPRPADTGSEKGSERALPRTRAPEISRPAAESPRRIETRPAPAPSEDWRTRAVETRKPAAKAPERSGSRLDPRVDPPAQRSVTPRAPASPRSGTAKPPTGGAEAGWRERPVTVPSRAGDRPTVGTSERSAERPDVRRAAPEGSDWRQRSGSSDRYSLPRRVIEGVRSNDRTSNPFRPDPRADRPDRVEPRPAPSRSSAPPARVESRPAPSRPSSPPARVQSRPAPTRPSSPPSRVNSRPAPSRPSSPPSRVQSQPSSSRPSSPPARARPAPSRSSSRATSPRSSGASSSSRSKARRKPPMD